MFLCVVRVAVFNTDRNWYTFMMRSDLSSTPPLCNAISAVEEILTQKLNVRNLSGNSSIGGRWRVCALCIRVYAWQDSKVVG